ncbi:hypothetical protein JCM10450v2_002832, partial [Rhodotorula kratochvilovae]
TRRVPSVAALINASPLPSPITPTPRSDSSDAMRHKIDLIVKQSCALSEDLRAANEDINSFRFDFDPHVSAGLHARLAAAKEAERDERQRVIDVGYDRIGALLHDTVQGYLASIQDERIERLRTMVETLKATVEHLMDATPPRASSSAAPAASSSASAPLAAPTPLRADPSLLNRLAAVEDWQRRHEDGGPPLEVVKTRVAALEAASAQAQQPSTDPRVRPGSRASSASAQASPVLAHARAQSPAPFVPQSELDALRGDVARLAQRVDGGAGSALGKRPSEDAPERGEEGPAAKVARTEEELGRRVEAVEKKLEGVSDKVDQAARDKDDEMDIEKEGAGEGLEKLEKRLDEMRGELDNELKPVKQSITALENGSKTLSSAVTSLETAVSTVAKDVKAQKELPTLPPLTAAEHPTQLLAALNSLRTRVTPFLSAPQLTGSQRVVLVTLCAAATAGAPAGLDAPAVGARLAAKLRAWDGAGAGIGALGRRVDELAQKLDKEAASSNAKFVAMAELSLFLEDIFPELKEISELIFYWREQRILPDAAWAPLDEEDDEGDEDDGAGNGGGNGSGAASANGAAAGANGARPAGGAAAGGALGSAAGEQAGAPPPQQQQRMAYPPGPAQTQATHAFGAQHPHGAAQGFGGGGGAAAQGSTQPPVGHVNGMLA